jgi:hypothetical protein
LISGKSVWIFSFHFYISLQINIREEVKKEKRKCRERGSVDLKFQALTQKMATTPVLYLNYYAKGVSRSLN